MKMILLLCMIAYSFISKAQDISLEMVRTQFSEGAKNKAVAQSLLKVLTNEDTLSPVLEAYKGAIQAVMAKHVNWAGKKYTYAKKGLSVLNTAVSQDPNNIEIRYLRFAIQKNVPAFLGLSKDLKTDKDAIVKNLDLGNTQNIGEKLLLEIVGFLIQSKECTQEDIKKLQIYQSE